MVECTAVVATAPELLSGEGLVPVPPSIMKVSTTPTIATTATITPSTLGLTQGTRLLTVLGSGRSSGGMSMAGRGGGSSNSFDSPRPGGSWIGESLFLLTPSEVDGAGGIGLRSPWRIRHPASTA